MSSPVLITLALILLEKTTCDVTSVIGYNYPQPPVHFDEPTTPAFAPPIFQDEIVPVAPIPTYLPPVPVFYPPIGTPPSVAEDDTVVIPPPTPGSLYQTPTLMPQIKILNMSCVLDASFKTIFRMERGSGSTPVMEDGAESCIRPETSNTFVIDMDGKKKLADCGVRKCTMGMSPRANMCVVMRMPTVKGVKLPEDGVVTLQCTPQDAVVSHTKHISLSPTTSNKGRSAGTGVVASGGSQRNFDSRILLLRKSGKNGNFDQPLQPGSVVLLGEELVLRAIVQDGDGWRFSRMGPVIIRSPSSQKSVTLVEENGCRSPGMRSICPHHPRQLSPLDSLLHFRAFLFQGSSRGEDMLLSVRMLGCLHAQDCYQNGACGEDLLPPLRFKRGTNAHHSETKNGTSDWETQIKFRVQMAEAQPQEVTAQTTSKEFLLMASLVGMCLLVVAILFTVYIKQKKRT